ncbi:hypothetical protein BJ138DRAFT_1083181 [Hygrophoropsis aurantiaca]|uniref:Uncharacterized protein n=1 Tax=Hygrophoropsis aurantiaca TaxID=72124 RepID=A0ACB8AI87_9AGAM|nr:hypothetical protein BJ138DRAFT_1083181 [Hygrophoropsis aurantiaca]
MSKTLLSDKADFKTFEGCPYFRDSLHSHTFLDAALRVTTKYHFSLIRANIASELLRNFPSTLAAFDALTPERLRRSQRKALSVINLARDTSCLELLPSAFYLCCRMSARDILHGAGKLLRSEDAIRCVVGRDELMNTWNKRTHPFLYKNFKSTTTFSIDSRPSCMKCYKSTSELLEYLLTRDDPEPLGLDLFTKWDVLGLCSKCVAPLQTQHQESREQLWEALPQIYALGSWEELRSQQAAPG